MVKELKEQISAMRRDADAYMENLGREAVQFAVEHGTYKDRTGNLRRSNYYRVEDGTLTIGNRADYASFVEAKGYDVLSDAIENLKGKLQ